MSTNSSKLWNSTEPLTHEQGDKFEGDMILTEEQMRVINDVNGVMDPKYLWPDKRFVYELDRNITNNQTLIIKEAMDKIEEVSCVSFVERTTEEDYVAITVCLRFQSLQISSL